MTEWLKKNTNRRHKIVDKYIMPFETLESVARAYGITRQRVEQIINKEFGRGDLRIIKKQLMNENGLFKCLNCGKPLNSVSRITRKYCSSYCAKTAHYYDLKNPRKCDYCGSEYFPFRNYKTIRSRGKYHIGSFCCIDHYLAYLKENRLAISKRPTRTYIPRQEISKRCVGCGQTFVTVFDSRKYHSMECYNNNRTLKKLIL